MSAHIDARIGNCPRYYLNPPKDWWMRLPDEVMRCVAFLGAKQGFDPKMSATCFFVRVPSIFPDSSFCYAITARHVVEDHLDGADWAIRANGKNGKITLVQAFGQPTGSEEIRWFFHPNDASVDCAVYPIPTEIHNALDINPFPIEGMATSRVLAEENIGIGDEISIPGLFHQVTGITKNTPTVRFGNVAMIGKEKIPFGRYGLVDVHLIENRAIGGQSGSPVFVSATHSFNVPRKPAKHNPRNQEELQAQTFTIWCFGLLMGHWNELVEPRLRENTGIALVVTADKILEVIHQPELVEHRKATENRRPV